MTKEGAGTWTFSGGTAFSGTLAAGRPELEMPLPSPLNIVPGTACGRFAGFKVPADGAVNLTAPLTWFRLTVTETTDGQRVREGGASSDQNVQMQEFALYDATGVRRNAGLTVDRRCAPSLLEPGTATYDRGGYTYYTDRDADKLFDDKVTGSAWCVYFGGKSPRRDDPSTWIRLTMRLADEDPGVASYDWCSLYAAEHSRTVLCWKLEGSADGETWITLDEKTDFADRPQGRWWSDGSAFASNQRRTGFPIVTDGMKDLVSLNDFACPIDLDDCADAKNIAKWKVCVNGVEVPRARVAYRDGALRTISASTVLLFR